MKLETNHANVSKLLEMKESGYEHSQFYFPMKQSNWKFL